MSAWECAVYAGFRGPKPGFHFLLRAQKKRSPATKPIFPSKRTATPINRLPTGLKRAALFLEVSAPYAT